MAQHHRWEMTPDNYPSVEEEPLSPFEQEMERHHRRFLPETTKALEAQGPNALATEGALRHKKGLSPSLGDSPLN